ncbi:PAS domain-containing sensor histidine kinase [Methanosarcina hadiensis]|uniref:PAS domain-containing sensor histidine kinase n=1 Tax=Methanosarcina hadiensis TaxID=3078083 RepID=UPI00397770D9
MTEKIFELNPGELKLYSSGKDSFLRNNPCNSGETSTHNSKKNFFPANEDLHGSFKENFMAHDITGRKSDEEELKRKEMQLCTAQRIAHIGSWEIDLSSGKVDFSEEARRICGLEEGQLTLSRIRNLPLPKYLPVMEKALKDLVERNLPCDVQFEIIRENDSSIRIIHSMAEYDVRRNVVIGTVQDITEKKQSEETLVKEARLWRVVIEHSRNGIVILDQNGKVFKSNPKYAEMLGYSLEEIHTLHMWDWDVNYTREQMLQLVRMGDSKGILHETRHRRKDGTVFDVEINSNSVMFGNQNLVFCICRDITERKKAEEELLNLKMAAEAANKCKDEFLAAMSHDLRTPLNSIIGFSDILLEGMFGSLNEKQTSYINNISKGGKHLLNLINNILDLSKIEAGKMELDCEPFYLSQAIDEIKAAIEPLAIKKNIHLDVKVDSQPGMVCADKTRFKQILYNLTSNAIKFTPEKGSVAIEAWNSGSSVQIRVSDTGAGISEADMSKLFQPFKQLNSHHKREYEGTGLGLVLVKNFVEMHGGTIWVKSKPGEGSTFVFTIPSDQKYNKRSLIKN